jgi:hypothetical protein
MSPVKRTAYDPESPLIDDSRLLKCRSDQRETNTMHSRRQFVQSVPALGAGIMLAQNMLATAQAQDSAPATPAGTGTVYTGDVINGKKVVSSLNTDDLEAGKKHLLYFQGVQMSTGQHWYVSAKRWRNTPARSTALSVACAATPPRSPATCCSSSWPTPHRWPAQPPTRSS